ncbi:MAG: DUF2927 domain-containing protein, partial [Bacteroidota bacterium]
MKKLLLLLGLILWFSACQKDPVVDPTPVDELSETHKYFKTVALKGEFGGANFIKKWKEDMRIFVKGDEAPILEAELERVVGELNTLLEPIEISIVDTQSESNYIVYFGSGDDYVSKVEGAASSYVDSNWGLF